MLNVHSSQETKPFNTFKIHFSITFHTSFSVHFLRYVVIVLFYFPFIFVAYLPTYLLLITIKFLCADKNLNEYFQIISVFGLLKCRYQFQVRDDKKFIDVIDEKIKIYFIKLAYYHIRIYPSTLYLVSF